MTIETVCLNCAAAIILYGIVIYWGGNFKYMIKKGIPAEAKILDIEKTGINTGSGSLSRPLLRIVFEIHYANNETDEVVIETTLDDEIPMPKINDTIGVVIDPKNYNKVMIVPPRYHKRVFGT